MGLFKDFKEDFSQAVNEMMPGAETKDKTDTVSYTHLRAHETSV